MNRRFASLTAVAAAASLILTGCTAGGSSKSTTSPSVTNLVMTTISSPGTLNPALSGVGPGELFVDLGYASLVHATASGKCEPLLAKSWEYVGTGNTDFKITLKSGLKFADGTPLNAAAVKASMEYFKAAKGPFSASMGIIDNITTPDPLTVEVKLNTPNPDLPYQFAEGGLWGAIISAKGLANPNALGTSTAGGGPYVLDSSKTVADSSYVYVPNKNFADKRMQKWQSVTIKIIADTNAALQSVTSGQSNWDQGTQDQEPAAMSANLTVQEAAPGVVMLIISDRDGKIVPALGNEKVRQAMNYAVDRNAIASVLGGKANQQIVAENRTGYSASAAKFYSYNTAKAKQLLAAGGYPNGFSMSVLVPAYEPLSSKALEIMTEEYARVGIKLDIKSEPSFADFARDQSSGKFTSIVIPWGGPSMYTVGQQLVLPDGVLNPLHTSDEGLNALFAKGAAQPAGRAASTWQQFSQEVTQAGWFVPMATVSSPFFGTHGTNPAGDGYDYPNPLYF
jgi:peptide/nickel transport system substrate-binding protein